MKNKLFLLLCLSSFIFFSTNCAEGPNQQAELLEQQLITAKNKNSLMHLTKEQIIKGGVQGFSQGFSGSIVEWAKKELEYQYSGRQTPIEKLQTYNSAINFLNNAIDLVPKQMQSQQELINRRINKIKADSGKQAELKKLEQSKDSLEIRALADIEELGQMLADLKQNYINLKKEISSSKTVSLDSKTNNNEKEETASTNTDNSNQDQSENGSDITDKTTESKPSLLSKLSAAIVPACIGGFNFVADNCGPKTIADWTCSRVPYLVGKETVIKNSITATGAFLIVAALYKTYSIISSDDEEEEEDNFLDTFSYKS